MAVVQCSRLLHYYDSEKYKECPHCANLEKAGALAAGLDAQSVNYAEEYIRKNAVHVREDKGTDAAGEEETEEREISRYAAGWLVCTEGEDYGRNFPVYAGYNRIGTDNCNDIVLNDKNLLTGEYCSVVYEEKKNVFYLVPRLGRMACIGKESVDGPRILEGGQAVMIGDTRLELVVFCAGEKRWMKK